MEKVVITGLGVMAATGSDSAAFWDALAQGRSGLRAVTRFNGHMPNAVAGEIRDFDTAAHFGKEADIIDRFAQLAIVCARQALVDAGLPLKLAEAPGLATERAGVITGTAMGGIESQDDAFRRLYAEKSGRMHPFSIPRMMYNAAASHISMFVGARGPSYSVSTACASSTHAVGEAWRIIRSGAADLMLAGGSDAPVNLAVFRAWEGMRVLAPAGNDPSRACRPFSSDRNGFVLAEGAGIFVLESERHARRRGARILVELAGYGATADAGHITQPSVEGPAGAIAQALQSGGLLPGDVDYINAHGTGTRLNDPTEIAAIKRVFGPAASALSISSTKSMHGHAMGASGAIELAATVLAMRHGIVPPTANFTTPDPECDLDVTPNQARHRQIRAALSNSFAFGGLNAVLALRAA